MMKFNLTTVAHQQSDFVMKCILNRRALPSVIFTSLVSLTPLCPRTQGRETELRKVLGLTAASVASLNYYSETPRLTQGPRSSILQHTWVFGDICYLLDLISKLRIGSSVGGARACVCFRGGPSLSCLLGFQSRATVSPGAS